MGEFKQKGDTLEADGDFAVTALKSSATIPIPINGDRDEAATRLSAIASEAEESVRKSPAKRLNYGHDRRTRFSMLK
jgi:hypothetical protein